ncbi:MAG: hypothetical protein J0M12_10225, partial [Deltaproteobacteria bacterium]|nr:hypothetical protein [Deltaproteobacteria bacterium]
MPKHVAPFSVATCLLALGLGTALNLSRALAAPLTKENSAWNVNRNPVDKDPASYFGEWPGHPYYPSPEDWRKISIYHVMTDRFSDGDPHNNEGLYGGYDPGRVDTRHGGDFKGLASKLDYIKSLGFDAILISPIFQNPKNGYHGYEQLDYTLLDDRLGTLAEFRELVDAAHQRGMRIIVDIVVNHLSSLLYAENHLNEPAPFRFHKAEYRLLPRTEGKGYSDFQVDNTFDPAGKYCDVYGEKGELHRDDKETGTFSKSDFHHNGDLTDYHDAWNIHLGQIYGRYNDLRHCSVRVQDKIIAMTKALISSTDIDGIRIDTPMQVPLSFFKKWTPAVKSHAEKLGKANFFMFGELYAQRARAATMIGRGKTPDQYGKDAWISGEIAMDSGIHYGFYKAIVNTIIRDQLPGALKFLAGVLKGDNESYDFWDPVAKQNRNRMLNFYDNHDQRRLCTFDRGFEKSKLASVLTAFWPGIPLYYYGDEQDFSSFGTALDGHGREDMMTSVAWDRAPAAQMPNKAMLDNFDMTAPTYRFTQQLYWIRKAFPGVFDNDSVDFVWESANGGPGVVLFARQDTTKSQRLVIALNTASVDQEIEVPREKLSLGTGEIIDLLNPETHIEAPLTDASVSLKFKPLSAKILVSESSAPKLPAFVVSISPSHDQVVSSDTVEARVTFSKEMDA